MADPISIGAMALTAGSQIFGAVDQSNQLRDAAAISDQNAHLAEVDGARQSEAILRQARATTAEGRAAMGANGVAVDTGSALDLITQNAVEREYDMLNARYSAGQQATAYRQDAAAKRDQAKGALIGGLLKAGASALTGYSTMTNAGNVRGAWEASRTPTLPRLPGTTFPVPKPYVIKN